jgi:cell division protein FtsI (penicillin-binding protein 3)
MLTAVTGEGGTGEAAALDGYVVAGKTGTAQKADYARGGYAEDQWIATFVGFVPAQHPRLVISVVIDEPVIEHYGGTVAGPVFRRVAEASLRHLGVAPMQGGAKLSEIVKQRRAQESEQAAKAAPQPARADEAAEPSELAEAAQPGEVRVPDLLGKGARSALVLLRQAGLQGTLSGSGAVHEQSPEPGKAVASGALVQLVLRRPPSSERPQPERESEAAGTSSGKLASAGQGLP